MERGERAETSFLGSSMLLVGWRGFTRVGRGLEAFAHKNAQAKAEVKGRRQ